MALWDQSQGSPPTILVGAIRRGAGSVGAQDGAHGVQDTTGTKQQCWGPGGWLWQLKFAGKRTAEKG